MNDDQYRVLQALYSLEEDRLQAAQYNIWATPADVAAALPQDHPNNGDAAWVRQRLEELWVARKVLQVTDEPETPVQTVDAELSGRDVHGFDEARLAAEATDCRRPANLPPPAWEVVALYGERTPVRFRSRVAEIARLLAWNYQRFNMAPATGLLRYVRRRQERPAYDVPIADLLAEVQADIHAGHLRAEGPSGGTQAFPLDAGIDRTHLTSALTAVLEELAAQFTAEGRDPHLAGFQARSLVATLAGLYCPSYRAHCDAHVVTAGVGSGKTFAFQLGALVHVAYKALLGERQIQVLLVYPRVVLAANQFQDLIDLISRVTDRLGVPLQAPLLDAGGQLPQQMGRPEMEAGRLFNSIRQAYQGSYQILISNLDTLARRLVHPEAFSWLTQHLDLIVLDEVHILSGLYGAHARMLLKRLLLLRALCRLRGARPTAPFGQLLGDRNQEGRPYFIGASATISEPREHTGRILSLPADRVQHLAVGQTQQTGWVHHFFIRQRPEVSSMSAVTNATSCLIHNRRDGLFREYYQRKASADGARIPLALTDLANPVQPSPAPPATEVELRDAEFVHKTIGFCDSLDGVGRWATFVGDNERTKAAKMGSSANPARGELPYFLRFQEPLWRVVHHLSFGATAPQWQQRLWEHYGQLCQDCKRGCKRRIDRIPAGLTQAQRRNVDTLWDFTNTNPDSYLQELGVLPEYVGADWFQPLHQAAQQDRIGNLDECAFFQTGLCWWWSMDHLGSNHPTPATTASPPNGLKRPRAHPQNLYNFVNAIRLRAFTSVTNFDAFAGNSINELFRASARSVFRDGNFPDDARENCALLIGSPRIEVGIDLDRASEGITFRALRDPASVQQKAGRVGREQRSDSIVLHIVTDNTRDHFYFRNPRIALDPEYLQPIPLHAGNQIVARNHYFMAIVDFLCLQGMNTGAEVLPANGHRLNLVNDHSQAGNTFQNWDQKVNAVFQFLFGSHSRQAQNLSNLCSYLQALGATAAEITNPAAFATLAASDAPMSQEVGAVDVFRHEFGPNFLLTALPLSPGQNLTLAQLCATTYSPPPGFQAPANLGRHQAFLDTYQTFNAPEGQAPNARRDRGYLPNLLTLPVFRRGLPAVGQPGNQPYLWTPALFEAVGNESVRVFDEWQGRQRDMGFERVGLALALLVPGTYTYRYGVSARKVPVARFGAQGLTNLLPRVEGVNLLVNDPDYYELAACPPLAEPDLPAEFVGRAPGIQVSVYTPQQIGLMWVPEEPRATADGLVADGDHTPPALGIFPLPQPPRTFSLRWYRVACSNDLGDIPCRFQTRYAAPPGQPALPRLQWPEVCNVFESVRYDPGMEVTDFVWGLDQQFTTRQVDPARLVYREGGDAATLNPVALGRYFRTPGIRFTLDFHPGSALDVFLEEVILQPPSGLHQGLLTQILYAFLKEYARNPAPPGAPFWIGGSRPSVFTARNLKAILLFHLLERWHPQSTAAVVPTAPPAFTLPELQGCFTPGHANFLDEDRFRQACRWLASVQNPTSADARFDTLFATYPNFQSATLQQAQLNAAFFKATARDLLLNTLGISIHAAALRLSGAEEADLAYFYRELPDGMATIELFDTDEFGNGTTNVIRDTFFVSPVERILNARRRALGDNPDPLPSTDFVRCLEEQLHECPSSQAAHLAFHDLPATGPALADLDGARQGEREVAGPLFDFFRQHLVCSSFDHTPFLQVCPEFLVHVGGYPCHAADALVPSPRFPSFQALESAVGYCFQGCIDCVVAPEQNLHGILTAKETVNKLLLDACYRRVVCEAGTPRSLVTYPGTGPARSVVWSQLASTVAAGMGQGAGGAPMVVALPYPQGMQVTVLASAVPSGWERLFRTDWGPCPPPGIVVRPRMTL